jgi:hypothetical protein
MKKLVRRIALTAPIVAAGLILGLTLPSTATSSLQRGLPRPERELAQAQRLARFPIHLPAWLPSGAVLERVSWPDVPAGEERVVTAVDVWYRIGRTRVHVWQTNETALEKNTVGRGERIDINGRKWWRERADLGTVLGTRLADGITVQVSAYAPDATLERIAGSFGE